MNNLFAQAGGAAVSDTTKKLDWEVFPIISYDTDAGFGYGIRGHLKNLLKADESLDLILYNSTKGERWYRFQLSLPDYEARQGTEFGYAVDLIADYDKWINYYFYGIGNSSSYGDGKTYTKQPFEINILLSRTITPKIVLQAGLRYSMIKFINFPELSFPYNFAFEKKSDQMAFIVNAMYDTRNSIINPTTGNTLIAGFETSPPFSFTNSSFSKALLTFQFYRKIIFPELILAGRMSVQQLIGNNIPVQFFSTLGGSQTLRGFSQDRFADKSRALINAELRFPIWKRLGAIAGMDAGRVFPSLQQFSFDHWRINPVAGLRYYMNNFVVRADVGISNETTGFYLNFGHIF